MGVLHDIFGFCGWRKSQTHANFDMNLKIRQQEQKEIRQAQERHLSVQKHGEKYVAHFERLVEVKALIEGLQYRNVANLDHKDKTQLLMQEDRFIKEKVRLNLTIPEPEPQIEKGQGMKDWADEIELTIAYAYSSHGAILAAGADGMIAAALRKAKADGMREAAIVISSLPRAEIEPFASGYRYAQKLAQDAVARHADKIEKGK